MTTATALPRRSRRPRGGRLRQVAPLPLVGVAVLLVALILITPVLISEGQPPPGIFTQAELIVDRTSGTPGLHFYVHGLSTTVRYDVIALGTADNFSWSGSGSPPWRALDFGNWTNATFVLAVSLWATENPVAVNVTASYASLNGYATYSAVVVFFVGPGPSPSGETLYAASPTGGLVPSSTPVDNASLPLTILLPATSTGSAP